MTPLHARSILAPVDFSPGARHAAATAAELAAKSGAALTLLYVHPRVEAIMLDAVSPTSAGQGTRRLGELDERLTQWARGLAVEPDTRVVTGDVVHAILDVSKRFDLLVISSHARKGVVEFLLGSTTERVVRAVECSVLIVRVG